MPSVDIGDIGMDDIGTAIGDFKDFRPNIKINIPRIPLGTGILPVQQPGPVIPKVVAIPTVKNVPTTPVQTLPAQVPTGATEPSNTTTAVQTSEAKRILDKLATQKKNKKGPPISAKVLDIINTPVPKEVVEREVWGVPTVTTAKDTGAETMDLGNIFGTLVGTAAEVYKAKNIPAAQTYFPGGIQPGSYMQQQVLDMPFVDVIPEAGAAAACETKKMNWNPRLGKWVPARRRRRRRLASTSDIKDIAALKAVLGPAQLKTWIATHS